jgi:hypothetical protein
MTYPAGFLAWLESLESRFNITAGHIWEAAQAAERERTREIIKAVKEDADAHFAWEFCCDTILEKIDATK